MVPNVAAGIANAFDITVAAVTTPNGVTTYKVLESWTKLVIGGAAGAQDPATVINDPNTGSKYVSFASGTFASWAGGTTYPAGTTVVNGGHVYVATQGGASAPNGPTGTAASVSDGSVTWTTVQPWAANHVYADGTTVTNNGITYVVTSVAGTDTSAASGGPTGTGTGIVDGGVTWAFVPTPVQWLPSHAYTTGTYVTNGPNVYEVTTAGTSAPTPTGPSGTSTTTPVADGTVKWVFVPPAFTTAWQASHAYALGAYATNGATTYIVTTAGTSAANGGPTGTGTGIVDGGVTWSAVAPYNALANGVDDNLSASTVQTLDTFLTQAFTTPSPFDPFPVELLACPESADTSVVQAALTYAFNRGDCMFVGHVPDYGAQPLAAAKTYGQSLQGDKAYGALYLPYIQVADPLGTLVWIPPTGHVLGVYARTEQQRGIWKAPAGDAALVDNALDVRATLNDTDFTDLVKNGSVNAIRPITGGAASSSTRRARCRPTRAGST